jgi:TRAP-type C4-dicarboxylate transport system permease small subunit
MSREPIEEPTAAAPGEPAAAAAEEPAAAAEEPTAAAADEQIPVRPRQEPRLLRAWASAELAIGCTFLVAIFVSVLWQVVSRYVPALNWPGIGELGNYSLIVLTFIMVGYLIGQNGHISIQVIDYLVKGRAFVLVRAVSALSVAVICASLAWEAFALIRAFPDRTTAALGIPLWMLYAVPLAGFLSGTVRAVFRIFTANQPDSMFDAGEAK